MKPAKTTSTLLFIIISILSLNSPSSLGATTKTVNVETAGTLSTLISNGELDEIKNLTIRGSINGTDWAYLFNMVNNLVKIDLSDAKIIRGGTKYMRVYAYSLDDRIESQDIDESEANAKKRINKTTIAYTTVDLYTGDNTISTNMFDSFMNLETIILPNSVTQMTGTPFYNCPKLKTVVIGQLLYKIAHGRIAIDCPNLSVNLNDNQYLKNENGVIYNYNYSELLMTLPNTTLPSFITIDSRTQSINPKSFYQHNEIKQIYMHEGLTTIGYMAFAGCESLLGIAIPSTVQTMKAAYKDCKSIQKVSIPESLFRIEASTFSGCESLMTITIPPTIESIDQYAFYGCI